MGWEPRFQNNDPSYLEPRISNAEASLSQKVSSVNGVKPDANGDVPASLNQLPDNSTHRLVTDDQIASWNAKGNGTVKSINNITPDENGNVTIPLTPTDLTGPSINRPIDPAIGTRYFDTTINQPIWYKGLGSWIDAMGGNILPPADTTPPNPVTSLTVGTITASSIILNWTNSSSGDVANYEVAYSSDGGTTYTIASSTITSAGATYTVTGLTASTAYTFRVIATDTAGNRSTGVTTTGTTIAGAPVPIVSDDFTRADSTTSAGTSDSYNGGTNKAWTSWSTGGMGISTNRLYAPTGTGQAWIDSGVKDARMEVTVTTVGNGHNFYFRVDGNGRYYRYAYNSSGWYLQEQNSSFTTIATITGGPTLKANDVVAVEAQGTTCKLYVNSTLVHTGTLADLLTNTGFGIGFSSTPVGYADNVNIYSLAPVSTGGTGGGTTPPTTTYTRPTAYLSVADYGATGTSSADVSTNIQNCINAANSQGMAVVIPSGTYWINLSKGLVIPSNMTIWFDQGAIIKGLTSSLTSYQMLRLWSVSNVNIIGYPTLIGDKAARPANTASEGGMGISLANASNINIDNANVSYCMGDGIYLGDYSGTPYNKTIKVTNSTFDHNNRQGMSVISAIDLTVDNCTFSNTGGNPAGPSAGVDFEPNTSAQYMQNLNFTNCSFINNVGHGVWGDLYYMNTSGHPISITVSNSTVSGNQGSIYGTLGVQSQIATRSTVAGYVKVNGSYIYNK